jgi:hypothetical protein
MDNTNCSKLHQNKQVKKRGFGTSQQKPIQKPNNFDENHHNSARRILAAQNSRYLVTLWELNRETEIYQQWIISESEVRPTIIKLIQLNALRASLGLSPLVSNMKKLGGQD